jgi:hypothetical protein
VIVATAVLPVVEETSGVPKAGLVVKFTGLEALATIENDVEAGGTRACGTLELVADAPSGRVLFGSERNPREYVDVPASRGST